MRTRVLVRVVRETDVYLDIEHRADEDPLDLTSTDRENAEYEAELGGDWLTTIDAVEIRE